MYHNIKIENISPSVAKELLSTVPDYQRKIKGSYVLKLAAEMAKGAWGLSPDALVIMKGALVNGQHRLSALVRVGRQFPFIVLTTKDEGIYGITDQGVKRTIADIIHVPHGGVISAAAKLVVEFKKGLITPHGRTWNSVNICTNSDIIDYANKNMEELSESAALASRLYGKKPILSKRMASALIEIGRNKSKQKAVLFVTRIYEGGGENDAAYDMRERLIKNSASNLKLNQSYVFGLLIKSMKSYFNGTRTGVLKITDGEKFPTFD